MVLALLNYLWCEMEIGAFERRASRQFSLVAFSRPDLLWLRPIPTWCSWKSSTHMLLSPHPRKDMSWVVPREGLRALALAPTHHRDCQPSGAFFNFVHIKASCCTGNPEYMFAYSISQGRLDVDTSSGRALYLAYTPLRFVVGVCEIVLSSRYKGAIAPQQHTEHCLYEAQRVAL